MTPDRLSLIERRWRADGCGDGDLSWLLEEVKRLREAIYSLQFELDMLEEYRKKDNGYLLARAERERRHGEWAMRRIERLKNERDGAAHFLLDEALNSGGGSYRP